MRYDQDDYQPRQRPRSSGDGRYDDRQQPSSRAYQNGGRQQPRRYYDDAQPYGQSDRSRQPSYQDRGRQSSGYSRDAYGYDDRGYDEVPRTRRYDDARPYRGYQSSRTRSTQRQLVSQDEPVRMPQDDYRSSRDYDRDPYQQPRGYGRDPYQQPSRQRAANPNYDARRNPQPPRQAQGGYRPAPSPLEGLLQDFPWIRYVLAGVALILAVVLLVNLFSCIAGAVAGPAPADTQTVASSSASEGTSESTSSSTEASQEGVESPWTDNGRFSTGDAELDAYVKQVCDEHSTTGAPFDENAYNTNLFISQTDYIERASNQSPYGVGWDVEYAKQYFEKGNSGNCYNFCAVTQFVLRYFGYSDAEAQPCIVHLQSDSWGDHGLVFVTNKVNGQRCLVDDALSADGWMLDIDAYEYDVRNIDQHATVKGNVDALDDDNEPRHIEPGNLTPGHEND